MYSIVETEKHRVALNCATCTMRCGNTDNYDLARLGAAPEDIRALKLRLLAAVFRWHRAARMLAHRRPADQALVLAEDWDEELLAPVVKRAEDCCAG